MKSLLEALKEGRLVELPESNKESALELLAHLIEAVPDIGTKVDLMKGVMEREAQSNTAIGRGLACPHCRVAADGELLCAVGWSPTGLDYGAPDGKRVHLLVMYYVPDGERNSYLKEISGLAKAVQASDTIETISALPGHPIGQGEAPRLGGPRDKRDDARRQGANDQARGEAGRRGSGAPRRRLARRRRQDHPLPPRGLEGGRPRPLPGPRPLRALEGFGELAAELGGAKEFDAAGYRIAVLSETLFSADRKEYDAVAIQLRKAEVEMNDPGAGHSTLLRTGRGARLGLIRSIA